MKICILLKVKIEVEMDIKLFKNPNGRFVKTGYGISAFIPDSLPPDIPYDDKLVELLSKAHSRLSELNGLGRVLPNPYLLIAPLMKQEALSSSAIEETYSTITQLYMFEIDEDKESNLSHTHEVANYVSAINYGFSPRRKIPFSLRLVRKLHKIMLTGVRGESKNPGHFRKHLVGIGNPDLPVEEARLIPAPKIEMGTALDQWEKFCHTDLNIAPLLLCALIHYQFEVIHPFYDGNGRVGRMLISIYLYEKKYLNYPLLFISRYFEQHRQDYYNRLQAVSEMSDWYGWFNFFLEAVAVQCEKNIDTARQLIQLRDKYHELLKEKQVPGRLFDILDHLLIFPIINTKRIKQITNTSDPTVLSDISKFVDLGILKEVPTSGKQKLFKMVELIKMLEAKP